MEERDLVHRREDDNRARHAGVYALYDWCWGGDDQWLYQASDENRLFSHDHGSYLPGGPYWTIPRLWEAVDQAHSPSYPAEGMDTKALVVRQRQIVIFGVLVPNWARPPFDDLGLCRLKKIGHRPRAIT